MSDRSPNLDLPYLQPSQAQKHVTHNEALQQLDAVVQLTLIAFDAVAPPAIPTNGDRYALGIGASGVWAGQDGTIALWNDPAWSFITPLEGWRAWGLAEAEIRVYDSLDWNAPDLQNLDMLGINTTADTTNRLAVASDAAVLSHDGTDHRLTINKAGTGDTATVLFQSNWTGHAEMGIAGSDNWSIKVSPDGAIWTEALAINNTTALVSGAAVQSAPTDTTPGRLMRADYGYSQGNLLGAVSQTGGIPTGAVIEQGSNANGDYVRWADGTQICWATRNHVGTPVNIATGGAYRSDLIAEAFPAVFISAPTVNLSGTRSSGDWDVWSVISTVTTLQFTLLHMKINSSGTQDRVANYSAIGRWY